MHWNHIRGAAKRAVKDWEPAGTVEDAEAMAEADLDGILGSIIVGKVKMKAPAKPGPTPWWNNKISVRKLTNGNSSALARETQMQANTKLL